MLQNKYKTQAQRIQNSNLSDEDKKYVMKKLHQDYKQEQSILHYRQMMNQMYQNNHSSSVSSSSSSFSKTRNSDGSFTVVETKTKNINGTQTTEKQSYIEYPDGKRKYVDFPTKYLK